jgi:hypothetical protein
MEQHGQSFNAFQVVAAWGTVAKMPSAGGEVDKGVVLQRLQVLARAKIQEMGAREVASIVHSMARIYGRGRIGLNDELMAELWVRATATARDFKPHHVSMLMWALAKMGIMPDAGLVEAMQGQARVTAGNFKPKEVATLMRALAKMGIKNPNAGLVEAMQGRARETAGDFTPSEVEILMQAFLTMGIAPDASLVAAMPGHVSPQEGGWSTAEITRCKDARGLLGLLEQHGHSFNAIQVVAAWGTLAKMPSAGGRGDEVVVFQRLQVLTRAKMPAMGAREVANVARSMAKIYQSGGMGVDDALAGELQARAMATAGNCFPQQVAMLMSAIAKMGITPDAGLVEAMQGRATATAGKFQVEDVAMLMSAIAKMGITPDAGLVEAMQGRARVTAGDFKPEEVAMLMSAIAKMGITPDSGLLEAMQGRVTATAGGFKPKEVAMLMSAMAKMDITPDADLVEAMQGRARVTAGDFKPQEVAMLISALVKMVIMPDAGLVEAMQGRARETASEFKFQEVTMPLQAFSKTDITPDASLVEAMPGRVSPREGGWSTTEIKRCRDARGLLGLVEQHGQSFNAIQVVAAWGTVGKMPSEGGGRR